MSTKDLAVRFPVYHTKCIDPWLTRGRRQCPICKRRIRNDGTCDMGDKQPGNQGDEETHSNGSGGDSPGERTPLVTTPSRQYTGQTSWQPLSEAAREAAAASDAAAAVVENGPDDEPEQEESGRMESSVSCLEAGTVDDDVTTERCLQERMGNDVLNTEEFVRVQDGHDLGESADEESSESTCV